MKKVLLAIALTVVAGRVIASSGNDLLKEARSAEKMRGGQGNIDDVFEAGSWYGFIKGVSWTLEDIDPKVCLPKNSTVGQSAAVVKQYLEQNPAQLHLPAQFLAREALRRAFPCR